MNNDAYSIATSILVEAADKVRALGLHFVIDQTEMPHGLSLSLHIAETKDAVAAAYVAMGHGSYCGNAKRTSRNFGEVVTEVLAADLVDKNHSCNSTTC